MIDRVFVIIVQLNQRVASIDGYQFVQSRSEAALKNAVANQPVSVAIAVGKDLQHYKSVFHALH